MYLFRARIKKEIICEFLPPKKPSNKAIILCSGMPSYPSYKYLAEFLSKKGYWVFIPRYRGSWESGGSFLKISPHQDILDIINQLPKGFIDLWNNKKYKIKNPVIFLIGASFGGPAVLLASKDKRVKKVIALSPVIDWTKQDKTEPLNWLKKFTQSAFGNGYRLTNKNWDKLKTGKFYNPAAEMNNIDPKKIFIIHAKDDKVVPSQPFKKFVKQTNCQSLLLKSGGHLSSSIIMLPKFWKRIKSFFKQ